MATNQRTATVIPNPTYTTYGMNSDITSQSPFNAASNVAVQLANNAVIGNTIKKIKTTFLLFSHCTLCKVEQH